MVIYWLFQNGANTNQHQDSYQRETILDKFIFLFFEIGKAKKSIEWAKYMYVSEICAVGIFVTFPWWLKNVKSKLEIAFFFQMSAILKFDFQKRKLRFFLSKLSKLHKKDPIFHVTTAFSLKQGETRTNSVPIPHPLKVSNLRNFFENDSKGHQRNHNEWQSTNQEVKKWRETWWKDCKTTLLNEI